MQSGSQRPLFQQVGRAEGGRLQASSRVFNLVIVLGVLLAVGAFVVELATKPPAMRYVEVDMSARPNPEE
jgi:hypothetical protein